MTAVQGLARGFTTLLVARLLVGVGEAGCSPPAHSMISDLFAPASRARALAIYAFGIPIGGAIGTFLGGEIRAELGWRWAFAVVGIPGVLLAGIVAFTLREPTRGHWDPAATRHEQASLSETLLYLFARPAFLHMAFAGALHAFYGYGAATFNIPFFERVHGFGPRELGRAFAAIGITAGVAGTFLGGYLTDRYLGRDPRAYAWVPGLGSLAAIPFVLGMYTAGDGGTALGIALVPAILAGLYLGPTFAFTQNLVPARMRTRAAAILLLVLNVVGMVFGPVFVGALSDLLKPSLGVESVRFALLTTVAGGAAWSVAHYALAARTLRRDLGAA
jgi:predicted MFS family arabinose efflux permease